MFCTHVYVFICISVAEIKGTKKNKWRQRYGGDGQSKKTRDVAPENFILFGAFSEEHATLKLTPMEGKKPAIDTCDRNMTKVKKAT